MKQFLFLIFCFFTTTCFAFSNADENCKPAAATTDATFCSSFETTAICYCKNHAPPGYCQSIQTVYNAMISRYKTVERACHNQTDTDPQTCIDDWNCYLYGGRDSKGGLCSSTGKACG